jgi:hypothetical protein
MRKTAQPHFQQDLIKKKGDECRDARDAADRSRKKKM